MDRKTAVRAVRQAIGREIALGHELPEYAFRDAVEALLRIENGAKTTNTITITTEGYNVVENQTN